MALAKSDFGIARLYAAWSQDPALRDRVFTKLEAEFNRTRRMLLAVTGQTELLETNSVLGQLHPPAQPLRRSRQPHPGRAHPPQARRARGQRGRIDRAITATINGISAGLRNTG